MTNFKPLFDFMYAAANKLQKPKLRMRLSNGNAISVTIAGQHSRNAGALYIKGPQFGDYYGKIMPRTGRFEAAPALHNKEVIGLVTAALELFVADPEAAAKLYGHETGSCCFCGTALSDPRSVGVGYGPICAGNYGLPWGEKQTLGEDASDLLSELATQLQTPKPDPLSVDHAIAKRDIVFVFGNMGFIRVASTGGSDPNDLLEMLNSVCNVKVTMFVEEPSRFSPKGNGHV